MTTPALPRFRLAGDAPARCEQAVRDSERAGAGDAGSLFPGIGADWVPSGDETGHAVTGLAAWALAERLISGGPDGAVLAAEFLPAGPDDKHACWLASVTLGPRGPDSLTLSGDPVTLYPEAEAEAGAAAAVSFLGGLTREANDQLRRFEAQAMQQASRAAAATAAASAEETAAGTARAAVGPFPAQPGGPPPGTPCPACGSPLESRGPFDGREPQSGVPHGHEGFGDTYLCGNPGAEAHWWAGVNGALVPPERVLTVVEAGQAGTAGTRAADEVYVVITPAPAPGLTRHGGVAAGLEVLDSPPRWNLDELGQECYVANVNGGDSTRWHPAAPGPARTRARPRGAAARPGAAPRPRRA